jgi:hypothetical protein
MKAKSRMSNRAEKRLLIGSPIASLKKGGVNWVGWDSLRKMVSGHLQNVKKNFLGYPNDYEHKPMDQAGNGTVTIFPKNPNLRIPSKFRVSDQPTGCSAPTRKL